MDITVIIPAYNEESVIEGTLKSLPKDIEIIVICNGCTDKTAEIAKKYAKVIEIEKKGVANARNQGAKVATYDKLVFLDADVQVDENVIGQILDTKANIGTTKVKPNNNNLIDKIMMFLKSKIHRFGFNTGLIFCTKEIYNKLGGFDTSMVIHEDGKFLRRGKKIGKFNVLNSYILNDMRRFRKIGYLRIIWYWSKETLFRSKKDYPSIR